VVLAYRHNAPEPPKPIKKARRPRRGWRYTDELDWNSTSHHRRAQEAAAARLKSLRAKAKFPREVIPTGPVVGPDHGEIDMAKKAKTKKTVAAKAAKGPGVIATIIETISRDKGASADEILAILVKAFPDRSADGMRKTVIIQSNKNCTSKETDEKRGRIYYRRGRK
jgi:hypothetical protein